MIAGERESLQAQVHTLVERVRSEVDHMARAEYAAELQQMFREATIELAKMRRMAMRSAVAEGWTFDEVAQAFSITRQRVEQIVKG